jgi:hypothetical protein
MEDEVNEPYNKKKLYERYKVTVDSMIEQWIYKNINLSYEW